MKKRRDETYIAGSPTCRSRSERIYELACGLAAMDQRSITKLIRKIYRAMPLVHVVDTERMATSMTRRDRSGRQWRVGDRFIELEPGLIAVPKRR